LVTFGTFATFATFGTFGTFLTFVVVFCDKRVVLTVNFFVDAVTLGVDRVDAVSLGIVDRVDTVTLEIVDRVDAVTLGIVDRVPLDNFCMNVGSLRMGFTVRVVVSTDDFARII
jgi:hypothetical protein